MSVVEGRLSSRLLFSTCPFSFLLNMFVSSCSMTVICCVCCLRTVFCSFIIFISISAFLMDCLGSSLIPVVSLLILF